MNLRNRVTRFIREQEKLPVSQTGIANFHNRCNRVFFAGLPDNRQDAFLRQEKFLLGENPEGIIKTQPLYLRPKIITTAKIFIALFD
jgi:hypothetical protein